MGGCGFRSQFEVVLSLQFHAQVMLKWGKDCTQEKAPFGPISTPISELFRIGASGRGFAVKGIAPQNELMLRSEHQHASGFANTFKAFPIRRVA